MAATFNGVTLLITLEAPTAGVLNQTVEQVYDDAKQWHLNANNRKYPFPFTVSGGEDITAVEKAGQYYFLRNDLGWRIQGTDEDQDVFWDGNLIPTNLSLRMLNTQAGRTVGHFGLQPLTTIIAAGSGLSAAQATQLGEIFTALGLDITDPVELRPSGLASDSGDIIITFSGDGIALTRMVRQP